MRTQRSGSTNSDGGRRTLLNLGGLIVVFLACWIVVAVQLAPVNPAGSGAKFTVQVTIPSGASSEQIADLLRDKGLARSSQAVIVALMLSGQRHDLKAGVYALSPAMPVEHIIEIIAEGKTDTVEVVVPEGFTMEQIADRLESKDLTDRFSFVQVAATEGESFDFADGFAPPRNLEGYLFPLTYNVVKGVAPQKIVQQMLNAFDRYIVRRHPAVHDWSQIVTVASLVEREAKVDSDRPLIASVYYNRLARGMPLQCDATVQYALPKHKARLLYSDLRIDSPYNTYLHRGLPPGPICNPGLLSIEAAIEPAQTDYLFYVAGPGGVHIFSRTLAEQDRNIALVRNGT